MSKIKKIEELISNINPKKISRLVVFEDNEMLFYDKGGIAYYFFNDEKCEFFISSETAERGEILSHCSYLELIINEIIVNFLNIQKNKIIYFDEIVDKINLDYKINILCDWGIISKKISRKLIEIKKVRNYFAHRIVPNGVNYYEKSINENYILFKKDYNEIMENLLLILKKSQPSLEEILIDLKKLID